MLMCMSVGRILSRGGKLMDFSKSFSRGAKKNVFLVFCNKKQFSSLFQISASPPTPIPVCRKSSCHSSKKLVYFQAFEHHSK